VSWLALLWERLWSRLWMPATLGGVFISVALTDVLPSFAFALHVLAVLASAGGIGYVTYRALQRFAWPTRAEARARLERTSPVSHRPLTTIEDSLAAGTSPVQKRLWDIHQRRAEDDVNRLRAAAPAPDVANKDRFALRAAVVLGLFITIVGGWNDLGDRLWRGILPVFGASGALISAKVWITPPAYTGQSPVFFEIPAADGTQNPAALDIRAGSKMLAVVTGSPRKMTVVMDSEIMPLEKLADESQRGEVDLPRGNLLELRQGSRVVASWDVNWIPDQLPTIAFLDAPSEANRWRLKIDYRASDDYGLEQASAIITRADGSEAGAESMETLLSIPPFSPKSVAHSAITDLTAHPWAGMKVSIQLAVTDAAGQRGLSETMTGQLPERIFKHPVSKELAKWRKPLMNNPERALQPATKSVSDILKRPESFGGDPMVHLSLSTAKYRLQYEDLEVASRTVPDLLWQTAVRIEDGSLAVAEQRLMDAEEALREAMERGASSEEINQLVDELQDALADYTRAMAENSPEDQSEFGTADSVAEQDITAMMEQVREMADLGAEEAAQQALAQLEDLLKELRNQPSADAGASPEVQEARELMEQMRKLAAEQSELLDENFEQTRQQAMQEQQRHEEGQNGQRGRGSRGQNQRGQNENQGEGARMAGRQASDQQDSLRQQLADLMSRMSKITGELPESLQDADKAMSEASNALRRGAFEAGVEGQGRALSKLEEGVEDATDMLLEALFEKGFGGMVDMAGSQRRFGPLGPRGGRNTGDNIDVPTEPDTKGMAQRVRAILEEIRQRASDRTRSEEEQDYLRRLMKQF
jgi:uncharacterized protein (TIGR02302 family)